MGQLVMCARLMPGAVCPIIRLVMRGGVQGGAGARRKRRLSPRRWIGTFGLDRRLSGRIIRRTIRLFGDAGGISAVV
jgi:hypothetical protein